MSARGGSRAEPCPGGHIGPPLHGVEGIPNQRKIGAKTDLANGAGQSPPPTGATQVVRSNGPMWAALRGDEGRHAESSCPTGGCGEPPRFPWVAAHSGASAARVRGSRLESRQRSSPKGSSTPDNPSVTAAPCQLPLHKGSLGWGKNRGDRFRGLLAQFSLLEVTLQQALESLAVAGLVAGHRCSPHWQAASRPRGTAEISRFLISSSPGSQGTMLEKCH